MATLSLDGMTGRFGPTPAIISLSGLEAITSSDLMIDGRRANHVPPQRNIRRGGRTHALFPHTSVPDTIAFGPEALHLNLAPEHVHPFYADGGARL